jgi:hypothetical protein
MMRIARVLAATALLLGTGLVADPASAAPPPSSPAATVTTTTHVTATCTLQPPFEPPRTQDYTVTVTVPRRVAPGSQAAIGVVVDYPVATSGTSTVGAVSVTAHQGDSTTQQFIAVPAGSPRIEGTATFPVIRDGGTEIEWTVEYWGQAAFLGGSSVSETCRPSTPIAVPATRIESGPGPLAALRQLLAHVCSKPSVPRPLVPLCRLIA